MLGGRRAPRTGTTTAATSLVLIQAAALVGVTPLPALAEESVGSETAVTVTVDARAGLAVMSDTGLGINAAVWDSQLASDETSDLLQAAGVQMIRYPGGSYSDIYHWEDNTAPGGYVAENTDFDTFMAAVTRVGAQPMIVANYGTGSAAEAAAWVEYANVTQGYGVTYWTIGNENYGNGLYGASWEADEHADKTATAYATEVVAYSTAMRAVDPTIKVGAVLTMPGNWPDGLVADGDPGTWNQTVLSLAGSAIDFVDVHWYPGGDAATSLAATEQIDDAVYLLREQIADYAGEGADRMGISLTELNVGTGQTTQPGALFLADAYSGLLENGVFTVDWWNTHNGMGTVSTVAGQLDYGDYGLLSSGTCTSDQTVCEPAFNTPFAPYHALSLMGLFVHDGDQFIRAGTSDSLVTAHAARRADGDLAVLLTNKDPDSAHPVTIDYAGYTPADQAAVTYTYTNGGTALASAEGESSTSATLPAYSLTLLVLHPMEQQTSVAVGAPGQPVSSEVTDTTVTISWPESVAGEHPIAKYEVYRQGEGMSEALGETSDTSLTVGNLVPGSRYVVNVLARDTAGNLSSASPPLTITTGTPADSTCAVRFEDTMDWGNGFVGSVSIANTGTAAIDGWTLAFTWPTSWQAVSAGWSGDWQQEGTLVIVTSTPDNGALSAEGGGTSTGFVGSYSGPNVLPSAFTLNGTVCSSM